MAFRTDVLTIVVGMLNADGGAGSTTSSDPKYNDALIGSVVDSSIAKVADALATPGHPDQTLTAATSNAITTSPSALAKTTYTGTDAAGAAITDKPGPIVGAWASFDGTLYHSARPMSYDEIRIARQDRSAYGSSGLAVTLGHYCYAIENGLVVFPGTHLKLRWIPADLTGVDSTISDKYANAAAADALAVLLPFMGVTDTAAGHYQGIAESYMNLVRQGKPVPPPPILPMRG